MARWPNALLIRGRQQKGSGAGCGKPGARESQSQRRDRLNAIHGHGRSGFRRCRYRAAALPIPASDEAGKGTFVDFFESLLVTILLALFGTTFIVQAFKIPSQSMEPTLLVGDHLLVNKFIFEGRGAWYEKLLPYRPVHRGDIVVFKFPYDDHVHYVKRVIGVPGDRIRIVNQQVFINGNLLKEPYVVHDPAADDPFGDNFPP